MNTSRVPTNSRSITYWLRHPDHWENAVSQLSGCQDQAVVEGLAELLANPPTAQAAISAIDFCREMFPQHPLVTESLAKSLHSSHASVRLRALRELSSRNDLPFAAVFRRLLKTDPAWMIRREAVQVLGTLEEPDGWHVLEAATDPHWRVRHGLIQMLMEWPDDPAEILKRIRDIDESPRAEGVARYLEFRWRGTTPTEIPSSEPSPTEWCSFWDWDPAVLAYRLEQMSDVERRDSMDVMPRLLGHTDDRVRRWASHALLREGGTPHLLECLKHWEDPRHLAFETVKQLSEKLDWERTEDLFRAVIALDAPEVGQWIWAFDQMGEYVSLEEVPDCAELANRIMLQPIAVRAAFARAIARIPDWPDGETLRTQLMCDADVDVVFAISTTLLNLPSCDRPNLELAKTQWQALLSSSDPELRTAVSTLWLEQQSSDSGIDELLNDSFSPVREAVALWLVQQGDSELLTKCQHDESPFVRRAAMTENRACELMAHPERETSWLVLEHAARITKTPFWNLEPEPLPARDSNVPTWEPIQFQRPELMETRTLGRDGPAISPLGLSGHYGLPVDGFVRAMEAGINALFWEPNYQTLTEFSGRLTASERRDLHFVMGTFEADPRKMRKDVERALAKLRLEQVAVFLLFWTRSWNRITDAVQQMLDHMKREGLIGTYGLSTHSRPLAVEAIERGWNPVMVRHSAAHRGAETAIFPHAEKHGTGLLTFNNTCYGRLLSAFPKDSELTAADCYRYTLSFPAVTACWTAPATIQELNTNLAALKNLELPENRRTLLREIGDRVYREDTIFRQMVREV